MKLQQLRYLCEIVDQGLNVSKAASALHTAQPGVSRQIRLLEQELGVQLLERNNTRVLGLTEIGRSLLPAMRQILLDAEAVRRRARESADPRPARLAIATTYTHARYVLPKMLKQFVKKHPDVTLNMQQANSVGIADMLKAGEIDIGISTATNVDREALAGIELTPCYRIGQSVITPRKHPLLALRRRIRLEDLLDYPIISLEEKSSLGRVVSEKFEHHHLKPNIVVRAIDSDVVKAYVDGGFGIAVIKSVAHSDVQDPGLRAISATHLFGEVVSYAMTLKRVPMQPFMKDFITMLQAEGGVKGIR